MSDQSTTAPARPAWAAHIAIARDAVRWLRMYRAPIGPHDYADAVALRDECQSLLGNVVICR